MADLVRAWRPDVPHVREVLHATFDAHAYPAHTHDDWTLLLVDDGVVSYDLERASHHAAPAALTLLPPHVAHDGRSAVDGRPFRKRVVYLERGWLPPESVGAAVDRPTVLRGDAVAGIGDVHAALAQPGDAFAAEAGLHLLRDVLVEHLHRAPPTPAPDVPLARRLRALLDDQLTETFTLEEAGLLLGAHPSHLVRCFSRAYGIAPHRYVTGRRVDLARRLIVDGTPPARAAVAAGFHDQSHLTRHFRRVLGTTPARFAA